MHTSLVSSLLPSFLIENVEHNEKEMSAVLTLITSLVTGTIQALSKKNYKAFDANPGDAGCQNRALELRRLISLDIETADLNTSIQAVKTAVNRRKSNPKETTIQFFKDQVGSITISKDFEYLLHCYFSKVLRTPYQTLENGVVLTKSEVCKLDTLSKNIAVVDIAGRRKILEHNQKRLSELSIQAVRLHAREITSLPSAEKEHLMTMLSPEHTRIYTPDPAFEAKYFGCFFYTIKTFVSRLQEEQGVICIKAVMPAPESSFRLFLQPPAPGEEFAIVDKELLPKETPVAVCEVVVSTDKERTAEMLTAHGFGSLLLTQAAKEPPYHPRSHIEEIADPAAIEEISHYRQIGVDFLKVDHVYLNTIGDECKP